jgi:hypothetical protein
VEKLRQRISVSKRAKQEPDLGRFHLKNLDDIKVKKKYQLDNSFL